MQTSCSGSLCYCYTLYTQRNVSFFIHNLFGMILYYVLQEFWISRIDEWCAIGCPKNLQPKGGLQQHVHDSMSYQISADTTGTYNPDSQRYSGSHDPLESNTSCAAESPKILLSQGKLALPWIQWTDTRTSQVIQWLDKHPTTHQMLFSDSLSVVREENRPVVRNTRDVKDSIYQWIARHVFKNDTSSDMRIAVDHHQKNFGDSVKNRLQT